MRKFILLISIFVLMAYPVEANNEHFNMPALVTSAGQGRGILSQFLSELWGLHFDYAFIANTKILEEGVGLASLNPINLADAGDSSFSEYPAGTKFETIIFCISYFVAIDYHIYELKEKSDGYSLAVSNIEAEYSRLKELIEYAKSEEISIIGIFYEDSVEVKYLSVYEKLIEIIIPECDLVIVPKRTPYKTIVEEMNKNVIEVYDMRDLLNTLKSLVVD